MRSTALLFFLSALLFTACNYKKKNPTKDADTFYTCSMDPQIMESEPGKCPICHMELTAVKKSNTEKMDEIKLSEQQIQLGNIHIDTLGSGKFGIQTVLNAVLTIDQSKTNIVSSWVMGRVDKLYYKNLGDYVTKGTKLFDLYSEALNNAKQEYLLALEKQKTLVGTAIDFNQLVQSAKNKLLLWGMSEAQLNELAINKKSSTLTTFYSTASGYITSMEIKEGDYVDEGGTIVKLADLSTLWAEAQVYASQLSLLDRGADAIIQIPDMPGPEIKGKIDFENPEISPDIRINLVRVTIPNPGNKLKPGMLAYVTLKSHQRNVLTLPMEAVLRDGKSTSVWVMTREGIFKNKMVMTGLENNNRIEIKSGLEAGDIVVVSGAYLINSEYIFKRGANPMEGMKM
jgi:Cu(I)/Ag(I) efflux system membrane fusion protein